MRIANPARIHPKTIFLAYFLVFFVYSIVSNIVGGANLVDNPQVISIIVDSLLPTALLDGLILAFVITAVYWFLCWFLDLRASKKTRKSEESMLSNNTTNT